MYWPTIDLRQPAACGRAPGSCRPGCLRTSRTGSRRRQAELVAHVGHRGRPGSCTPGTSSMRARRGRSAPRCRPRARSRPRPRHVRRTTARLAHREQPKLQEAMARQRWPGSSGLPRPALSIRRLALASLASWISSSLSSNGERLREFLCRDPVCLQSIALPRGRGWGSDQADHERPQQGQQHVGQRVGDGERHGGHRALPPCRGSRRRPGWRCASPTARRRAARRCRSAARSGRTAWSGAAARMVTTTPSRKMVRPLSLDRRHRLQAGVEAHHGHEGGQAEVLAAAAPASGGMVAEHRALGPRHQPNTRPASSAPPPLAQRERDAAHLAPPAGRPAGPPNTPAPM